MLDLENNWEIAFLHEYIKYKVGVGALHFQVSCWCTVLCKILMDCV
jgi:hypothetical protein